MGKSIVFPQDFFFGVADADLQVIGEAKAREAEGSEQSMWDWFARNRDIVHNHQSPAEGIDRYTLWKQDAEIIKSMGAGHYRTSVSMSRLLNRDGSVNTKAASWYKQYFKYLKDAGIKLYVTLYHWELPQYVNEEGGWKNRKTTELLVTHAKAVVAELGEYIEEYFILNEPRCSSLISYYYGAHAPGETDLNGALKAAHHLLLAQGMVVDELTRTHKNLKLSTVVNVGPRYAETSSPEDIRAARHVDGHKNTWFIDPLFYGSYPQDMLELYEPYLDGIDTSESKQMRITDHLHTLALNYYRGDLVRADETAELGFKTFIKDDGPKSDLGWGIFIPPQYPPGLYDILLQIYFRYKHAGLSRMYVAENGIAVASRWDGKSETVEDKKRIWFYANHLKMIHDAIVATVPVVGYFAWTLMDNYEWQEGYQPEASFGLIHVDRATMKRVWKTSAHWYKHLIASKTITSSDLSV